MSIPQTESSDMRIWEQQEWILGAPLNIPVLLVEAPDVFTDLRSAEPPEAVPGDFAFVWPHRERNIDSVTHETLFQRSLQEYSDIWRTLAER